MTLEKIDIDTAIAEAEKLLKEDQQFPPSQDQNRQRLKKTSANRKASGQPGRKGATLTPVDNPEEIETLKLDRRTLSRGNWHEAGFERRQVIDIRIEHHVTEYRVQILENEHGQRAVADFPSGVTRPAQYGGSVKAHSVVYLSMF